MPKNAMSTAMATDHISLPMCHGLQRQSQVIVRGRRLKTGRKVGREGSAILMEFPQRRTSLRANGGRD